jgi:hypothetical protein
VWAFSAFTGSCLTAIVPDVEMDAATKSYGAVSKGIERDTATNTTAAGDYSLYPGAPDLFSRHFSNHPRLDP